MTYVLRIRTADGMSVRLTCGPFDTITAAFNEAARLNARPESEREPWFTEAYITAGRS